MGEAIREIELHRQPDGSFAPDAPENPAAVKGGDFWLVVLMAVCLAGWALTYLPSLLA